MGVPLGGYQLPAGSSRVRPLLPFECCLLPPLTSARCRLLAALAQGSRQGRRGEACTHAGSFAAHLEVVAATGLRREVEHLRGCRVNSSARFISLHPHHLPPKEVSRARQPCLLVHHPTHAPMHHPTHAPMHPRTHAPTHAPARPHKHPTHRAPTFSTSNTSPPSSFCSSSASPSACGAALQGRGQAAQAAQNASHTCSWGCECGVMCEGEGNPAEASQADCAILCAVPLSGHASAGCELPSTSAACCALTRPAPQCCAR